MERIITPLFVGACGIAGGLAAASNPMSGFVAGAGLGSIVGVLFAGLVRERTPHPISDAWRCLWSRKSPSMSSARVVGRWLVVVLLIAAVLYTVAISRGAPDITSIIATNSSALIIFTEPARLAVAALLLTGWPKP